MNKDVVVLRFSVVRDTLGPNYSTLYINRKDLMPKDLRNFRDWLGGRYILSYRNSIEVFFKMLGVNNIEDFMEITNCISLKDSYWVKGINSKKSWNTVSPFRNPLNKVVADYSFSRKINGKNITGSPDFSTDGNFPKCWRKTQYGVYLYKAGSSGACNAGNEPYSEVYAYKIAKEMGINALKYDLGEYKNTLVSKCKCMTSEKIGMMSYRDLTGETECDFKKLITSMNGQNKKYIIDMLLLDYVICNVDRHYGNIGVLLDNDKNKVIGFTPLYDHNLSCIPYYMEDESLDYYISDIRAKDGRTWEDLYRLIDSKYSRDKLSKLLGKSFSIGCKRDKIVNKMVKHQIEKVLGR